MIAADAAAADIDAGRGSMLNVKYFIFSQAFPSNWIESFCGSVWSTALFFCTWRFVCSRCANRVSWLCQSRANCLVIHFTQFRGYARAKIAAHQTLCDWYDRQREKRPIFFSLVVFLLLSLPCELIVDFDFNANGGHSFQSISSENLYESSYSPVYSAAHSFCSTQQRQSTWTRHLNNDTHYSNDQIMKNDYFCIQSTNLFATATITCQTIC